MFMSSDVDVWVEANRFIPCPYCGGEGENVAGLYRDGSMRLFDAEKASIVVNALLQIQGMIERGASAQEIEATIEQEYPFLEYLKGFLPHNVSDLREWVALSKDAMAAVMIFFIMLAVANIVLQPILSDDPSQIDLSQLRLPEWVHEMLRDAAEKLDQPLHDQADAQDDDKGQGERDD